MLAPEIKSVAANQADQDGGRDVGQRAARLLRQRASEIGAGQHDRDDQELDSMNLDRAIRMLAEQGADEDLSGGDLSNDQGQQPEHPSEQRILSDRAQLRPHAFNLSRGLWAVNQVAA